jgi:hypothetical protein
VTWSGCTLITPFDDYRLPPPGNEIEGGVPPPDAPCPPGQKSCNGGCVPTNLPEYGCAADSCVRCSVPFAENVICENGRCAAGTCRPGHGSCDGNAENGCEADLNTGKTCGSCTVACGAATPYCTPSGQCVSVCPPPLTLCNSSCVDLQTSEVNCRTCGNVCPSLPNSVPKCAAGECTVECNVGYGDCTMAPGCEELKPYYVDGDGDGFGAGSRINDACTAPAGHSLVAGDCLDTDNRVKPGQTSFFAVGYTNASGKLSYDYDCNGSEQAAPGTPVTTCAMCAVGSYVVASRANPPPNPNLYCGSTQRIISCSSTCSTSASGGGVACR